MIDVVYVLGNGSRWEDNELRYSLRSVEKHLKKYDKIIIVGEKPDWVKNVIHIPKPDLHKEKETRIALKVKAACNDERVSKNFLFMNDDIFLTKPEHAPYYPNYYSGSVQEAWEKKNINMIYRGAIKNTLSAFHDREQKYFDIHTPIIYNKDNFLEMMERHDWNMEFSFIVKSLYGNRFRISATSLKDCKIDHVYPREEILERIKNRPCFSVGDRGLTATMKDIIEKMFPEKSQYEI
jgi:hypothetical protein